MSRMNGQSHRIADLAERLVADIGDRDLQPGDRYLSTSEASKFLGVGSSTANLALQLLDRRSIISRQQRRGAFIVRRPDEERTAPLRSVHFLVHQKFFNAEGVGNDHILIGMQQELPGVQVQISFLPTARESEFVADLIHASLKTKAVDGFILVRAGYEIQRLVSASGLPAVVYGSVFPGVGEIARFDRDMFAVGQVLTNYLLDRGHQRLAYYNRQQSLPGDQVTIDGITHTMGEAGFKTNDLTIRFLPSDDSVCQSETKQLLQSDSPPTAFICRTVKMAESVRHAISEAATSTGRESDIVVCDCYARPNEKVEFVYARPQLNAEQQGHQIASLLASQARGVSEDCREAILPIELCVPKDCPPQK